MTNNKDADLLIYKVFNKQQIVLPNIEYYKKIITLSTSGYDDKDFDFEKSKKTDRIRNIYKKYSFPILTHELFNTLKSTFDSLGIKSVSELSAGTGYFSLWAQKYGINIVDVCDNFSWEPFNFKGNVLDMVQNEDSVKYVMEHPKIDLFILSWPYADEVAATIWAAMQKGQYLLYIGEDSNGGNANDLFFKYIKGKEVLKANEWLQDIYITWFCYFDKPILLRK